MLLSDEEIQARMESPLNLLNRLKGSLSPSRKDSPIPSLPPSSDQIIEDLQEKINYGSIKSKAMGIMTSAMDELKARIPEVHKPEKLAQIAAEMAKVVNNTQIKFEDRSKSAQIIIYAPQIVNEDQFDVIDMSNE